MVVGHAAYLPGVDRRLVGFGALVRQPDSCISSSGGGCGIGRSTAVFLVVRFCDGFFTTGPLQEEFGWRGYVVEHLRNKYSALTAAIIAGLLWGGWHAPLFFADR